MESWILALDFGGTKHTLGVIEARAALSLASRVETRQLVSDSDRRALFSAHRCQPVPPARDGRHDLDLMLAAAFDLLAGRIPAAIGVSFGGPVDAGRGVVPLSHHIPGWENFPLRQALEQAFGCPASVDNDANVAALGEQRYGGGQAVSSMMYVTVSTGVGGGWILNNQIWRGANSMAGEIGHTIVDPHGPSCLCGKRGCVERLASGPYLVRDARAAIQAQLDFGNLTTGRLLYELVSGDLDELRGETIGQAAALGDGLAIELAQRAGWAVGVGIGNAANLINPQCFLLAGGVTKIGAIFWDALQKAARQVALPQVELDIRPALLGDDAPLWGSVALAQDLSGAPHQSSIESQ